jgi:GNAT superfamily N-acetyltransferase
MVPEYRLIQRPPTLAEYQALRRLVGWPEVDERATAAGLDHALYSVCVLVGERVIGCGRVVGDGGIYFYLQDVIVHPDHRGRGLGRRITESLMAYIADHAGRHSFVGLMAAEGVVDFYTPFGFTPRPPGRPGMYRMWDA